ncbi:MAG: response regulator [Lachnospiraceae bacterium]|nr:response regulator [Lachnospiraceae bacterium]
MNRLKRLRLMNFLKRVRTNLLIILLWVSGIILSYLFFLNAYGVETGNTAKYYMDMVNVLCISMLLLSTFLFYFLFNHTYEKNQIVRNIRSSNYISLGLDLLNERFVLIDLDLDKYEFLYNTGKNEQVMKSGPYSEFMAYLLDVVVKKSDREMLERILPLESLKVLLRSNNSNLCIPIELEVQGVKRWDLMSFIPIEEDFSHNIRKVLLSRRDITDTRKKEVEQQKLLTQALAHAEDANKAKSTFLFNMSHDIRTPMNAIIGFTTMAKKSLSEPEKAEEYLSKVEMSSQHMLHIINDVLDMARIDSGKVELESAPINIYKECYATDALFRSSMEEKQIDFSVKIDIIDDVVLGDAMRIKQIIVNLVSNAMKYTKPGGSVTLQYKQTGHDLEEGYAFFDISIRDTGIGMSEEYQRHLFEAFERERNATVSGIEGTGLGLAIAKQLTDLMGGTLSCNSKLGSGTEFILKLKLPIAGYSVKLKKEGYDISAFQGKRILLVEDNDLNREIAVDTLQELGFLVDEATDGSIAVEKIRTAESNYYQLILMDIQMPYMDGYYATHTIRMLPNKEIANIPIIAMTANAFDEDRKKAFKAGMNAHLSKPINEKQIIETLLQFM